MGQVDQSEIYLFRNSEAPCSWVADRRLRGQVDKERCSLEIVDHIVIGEDKLESVGSVDFHNFVADSGGQGE